MVVLLCFMPALPTFVFGQASLPTSYSFWGEVPAGWTINSGGSYQQGSDNTPACRLDATGQYVEIFFNDEPGELIYYLKGMTGSTPWNGTFSIQESVNGQSWSTMRNIASLSHQTFTELRDTLNINSRYARFYYTNKVGGSNVALDDITLTQRIPGENAFIYIYFDDERTYSGSQVVTGNAETSSFLIKNIGSIQNLSIQQTSLAGTHANQFSLANVPSSIPPNESGSFELLFNPSGNGSRFVTIEVQSNAENIPNYIIPVYAIAGEYATQPQSQPGGLVFTDITSYTYNAQFGHASPQPEGYIVLRSTGQAVIGSPADGYTYHVGDAIGNARVVHIGNTTAFSPTSVLAGIIYHHSVFSFNGPKGYENYLQDMPLAASTATPANMIGDFYEGVNSKSEDFIETLQERIRPHNSFAYGDYTAVMIDGFESLDTTGGEKVVYCVYSGYAHIYEGPFGWDGSPIGGTLSREHTFAHSWYPTHPSTSGVEYSDFFNLFPAHLQSANIPRSNHPLGLVVNVTSQFLKGKLGTDLNGNTVYEPMDAHKGDAARAMFYMVLRYHNDRGNEWHLPQKQDQNILKLWHFSDPPDAWEKARNDYIHSQQGNRNPFIDSIHFVTKIDFQTMEWLSVEDIQAYQILVRVFPNPVRDQLRIELHSLKTGLVQVTLYDLNGIALSELESSITGLHTILNMDFTGFARGAYLLRILCHDQVYAVKVIKL